VISPTKMVTPTLYRSGPVFIRKMLRCGNRILRYQQPKNGLVRVKPQRMLPPQNPNTILNIASAFMRSKLLFAASRFGLFEKIGSTGKNLDELAIETKLSVKRLRILADAMVALELLEKENDLYKNSKESLAFLSCPETEGLRPFLFFWDQISYSKWMKVQEAFRGESLFGEFRFNEAEQLIFSEGIESITRSVSAILPQIYNFTNHTAVLDLGGGTGTYLQAIIERYPHMNATLCELPKVAAIARTRLAPYRDKIAVLDCDIQRDQIPGQHDVILIANMLHIYSPERNRKLLTL
jgi:hypothetical protein